MKIAVLGTGMVGVALASKLVALGHEVTMGSRSASSDKGEAWLDSVKSDKAKVASFADAAAGAELILNATRGSVALDVLHAAGAENLKGKILVDISNPLDFSNGMPPTLTVCNTDSIGEQIQAAFPEAKVVKTLNTVNANLMVDPSGVPGDHTLFVSGNDAEAKKFVEKTLLREWFGWKNVIDLGDITSARGTEMFLPLWVRLWGALGTPSFNIQINKAPV
jgi:8-hydroxy-5-deazaflavin:NADPH oxidoreductase